MIQIACGLVALIASGWLLWDVSIAFEAGGLVGHEPKSSRLYNRLILQGFGKLFLGWVLAVLSGVLLS